METLIVLNFFSEFGNNKKLLTLWKEFKEGKNKYSKNYAEKTKVKRIEELKKIEKELPNEKIPLCEQIMYEYELLGYPISTYDVPKQYSIVLELDKKYTPKVLLYNLNTGKIATVKVAQKLFNQNKFEVGDVLYITKFIKKPQVKYEDGQYIEIKGEFDWWIEKYEIKSF
jgi:DNA polymerase-3 subunit alpha